MRQLLNGIRCVRWCNNAGQPMSGMRYGKVVDLERCQIRFV